MVDESYPGVYVEQSDPSAHRIEGVETSTAGMVGVTGRGPVEARLVTSWTDFTECFGDSLTVPEPAIRAQWMLDAFDGGEWWHFGLAVKGFFDNGGRRLYVKRVGGENQVSLRAADFVRAIQTFERFDAISILLAPGVWSAKVQAALIAHCEADGRCFAVLDAPAGADVAQARAFRAQRHGRSAALYFPWIEMLEPRTAQLVTVPASAHVAGVYARVDRERGVFKAPANETVQGVASLAHNVTGAEAQTLGNEGVNTLRTLDGNVKVWGARTLSAGEWNYVNVRRLLIFIEESIAKSTRWVVFEPNDEPLWAQLRRSVLDFLLNLWRAGGLAGATPEQAFFVRCDRTTMTQDDIDQGRLVCEVGVAPLRPAEFVIVRIGQWTADRRGPRDAPDDDRLIDPPYIRCEPTDDCPLVRDAIGPGRRVGTLVLVSGADRDTRTAAAYNLARLANLAFHRIDLSRVVSQYIGDTEKNLKRIFDAAKADGMLFFDEAEALFGKRSEVREAQDRYTNLEVAYLLQRIELFAGVLVLTTNGRTDVPASVRRFARCGVEIQGIIEAKPPLPDLSSAVDLEVVATNLHAIQALYFAAMLEELALFRVVDRLVELFMQGLLPLGGANGGTRLSQYAKRSSNRLSEAERRELYARVFGMAGGEGGTTPNREFDGLWMRFVSDVASWVPPGDNDALRALGRDLAINLSLHGSGLSLYASNELAENVRDAIAILADPDVRAAYGARDMWQVIDQVATLELGGARNAVRYRTMAAAGGVVIAWLATHLERLAPSSTGPVLELAGSASDSNGCLGPPALSQPSDADLVTACKNFLEQVSASPGSADGPWLADGPGDFPALVAALLATGR